MLVKAFLFDKVYVRFSPLVTTEAFLVVNGKVTYLGNYEKVKSLCRELGGEVVDLRGYVALPGFIDTHTHLDGLALTLKSLDLRGIKSIKELRGRIKSYLSKHKELGVLYGRGWDQELFSEGRWPTKWDIDDLTPNVPTLLIRLCGHAALVNSLVIKELGLDELSTPNVVRDEEGKVTGIVKEEVVSLVWDYITSKIKSWGKLLLDALNYLSSLGVTTVGYLDAGLKYINELMRLRHLSKGLPVRVRAYLSLKDFRRYKEVLGASLGDEFVKIVGIKLFADGSLGARTAYLSTPYNDEPSSRGQLLMRWNEVLKYALEATEAGLQVATHAIGDAAIDEVLRAYEELIRRGINPKLLRIEHASVLRPDQMELISKLGIKVSVQPRFIISDWWVVKRVGRERAHWVYPFKSIIKLGIDVGASTDTPVEPANPWESIYAAVSRGSYEGIELSKLTPNETLSTLEILDIYTRGSAKLLGEDELGTLEVGKYADFIVLKEDPLKLSIKELRSVKVLATYLGGRESWVSSEW